MTRKFALLACSATLLLTEFPVQAETLQAALQAAYENNPTLGAHRAAVRAADEGVPQALAAGRPTLEGSATYQENLLRGVPAGGGFFSNPQRQVVGQVNLTVPIITFGAVRNSVRAAQSRVEASRMGLRGTESELFTNVVGAYMDVLRDEAVVQLNERNTEVMLFTLGETRERNSAGNRGPTDVAQAEARLALAQSQLETARAQLVSSRETYIRLVGHPPGQLDEPEVLPNLPATVAGAVSTALANNQELQAARAEVTAAGFDADAAQSARLPRISGVGSVNQYDYLGSLAQGTGPRNMDQGTTAFVGMRLDVPLFDGGRQASQVRQARARQEQTGEQVIAAERAVVAQARSAYATWQAASKVTETARRGVDANLRVLTGLRAETAAGFRPLLDRLNAEQELLNAQVTLVTARRDAYVAGFALLASMGLAEARNLNFDSGVLYDPVVNYEDVKGLLLNWNPDPVRPTQSTSTAETPPQDAIVAPPSVSPVPQINQGQ
ncbi:MAG: type I secretion protein TolC [Novosphingobium sp. 17-62-19]|uniref:TolC family outer membrane protein n=1 Tax=Novosphingobium sp. 17-62-19 TaxID=1970406 RepID=UPI000BC8C796|nr:TolC family outer membrane protein [Novosphingobium sp. 17-62-19]OZA21579.1 MAG: type I secretion protein TolC [Novosphingobium sp. 17-62-19]HQS95280.1 TolC family outer membrane protein [Novosphingobium sp.]